MPKLVPTRERLEGCCMDHSDNRQSNSDHCVQQIGSIVCQHVTLKKRSKTGHYKVICVPASIVSLLASLVLGAEDLATWNSTVSVPQWCYFLRPPTQSHLSLE